MRILLVAFVVLCCGMAQSVCADQIIIFEQEFSSSSQGRSFTVNRYNPGPNEEVRRIELEYFSTNGYVYEGINPTSRSYTVTIDLLGLYQIDTPTHGLDRFFDLEDSQFAPAGVVISGSLGSETFSGTLSTSAGSSNFDQYVGPGTFEFDYSWGAGVTVDPSSFSRAVDPIGTVNTFTFRHFVSVVPEPSSCGLFSIAMAVIAARRRRRE